MAFCEKCGQELGENDFCQKCNDLEIAGKIAIEDYNNKNNAITGLVLGILSIVLSTTFLVGTALGICGIIFGIKAQNTKYSKMAKAGKITGILGIILGPLIIIILTIIITALVTTDPHALDNLLESIDKWAN